MPVRRFGAFLLSFVAAFAASIYAAGPAHAATITVTTTADTVAADGGCSLREAITAANGNGMVNECTAGSSVVQDTIAFNIPGAGPHTIIPSPALPIVGGSVFIDGTTQSGYVGSPLIEITGTNAGQNATGLSLTGNGSTVRALAINRFDGSGIHISGSNNLVDSSYIGTDVTGTLDLGNRTGISVSGAANQIGNPDPNLLQFVSGDQYRNVISGNGTPQTGGGGIFVQSSGGTSIVRSNIGTTQAGNQVLGNSGNGILVFGNSNNTIGSTDATLKNIISGNSGSGVEISNSAGPPLTLSSNNTVIGNYIGTNPAGADLGNETTGVSVAGLNNTVGGTATGAGNVIHFNGNASFFGRGGVIVRGSGHAVLGNSIFFNDKLGIDLGGDELTPNDEGDGDMGDNDLQNFPVIYAADEVNNQARVRATLDSEPNTAFRVEYFDSIKCDNNNTGHGEGVDLLGSANVTTDGDGQADFTKTLTPPMPSGAILVATATKIVSNDPTNTSEFSACFHVPESDVRVTKDSPASVKLNKPFKYSIEVFNDGPDAAQGVQFQDVLPKGAELGDVKVDGNNAESCNLVNRTLACDLGPLGSGNSFEIEITARLLKRGTFTNTASASITTWDPDPNNNEDQIETVGTCDKTGNSQANTINGTAGADVLCGLGGNDTINGKGGKDFILASGGKDVAKGGGAADIIFGNAGRDSLYGNAGGDTLNGGGGSDLCRQGAGAGQLRSCER